MTMSSTMSSYSVLILPFRSLPEEQTAVACLRPLLFKPALHYLLEGMQRLSMLSKGNIGLLTGEHSSKVFEGVAQAFPHLWMSPDDTLSDQAQAFLEEQSSDTVLFLWGDRPLLPVDKLISAVELFEKQQNQATVLYAAGEELLKQSAALGEKTGVGCIVRRPLLMKALEEGLCLDDESAVFACCQAMQGSRNGITLQCGLDALTVNHPIGFLRLQTLMNQRIIDHFMHQGVFFEATDGVLIAPDAKIGKGTTIYPGTIIKEGCAIGEGCTIGPNTCLQNTTIGNNSDINASQIYASSVGNSVSIGPFSHIRMNSSISDGVKIGDFVEVKQSVIDEKTAIAHLTYVGDSDVGKNVNFGCGVVTVNYDGHNKHRCTIGDGAFIGCNTNLIAPVRVGERGYTAAGSTITEDVPPDSLSIARARQVNKEGYAEGRYKKGTPKSST